MSRQRCYKFHHSSALNKISARLPEGREFIAAFDLSQSIAENVQKAYMNRWYGNASERTCNELTRHFKQRYVISPENFALLRRYVQNTAAEDFAWLNHFYMLLDDPYYRWATAVYLPARYQIGMLTIPRSRFDRNLKKMLPPTVGDGSLTRYAQNLLTAIRDNGLLKGKVKKTIASPALPAKTLAYMLYTLSDGGIGANAFDSSPLFLSLLKTRDLLTPIFSDGQRMQYWEFSISRKKIKLTLNQPDLKTWLEACIA